MTLALQTANVLVLNDDAKLLLKCMNFESIPEEATHVAFFPDGLAQFIVGFETPPFTPLGYMHIVQMYRDFPIVLATE